MNAKAKICQLIPAAISTNPITRLPFRPFSLLECVQFPQITWIFSGPARLTKRCGQSAQAARNKGELRGRISNPADEALAVFLTNVVILAGEKI